MPIPADLKAYRELYPVTRQYAYLNHAGVCPVSTRVVERVQRNLQEQSEHGLGLIDDWEASLERVRASCARLIGAGADEVAFVRNTSHGLSLVAAGLDWRAGDNVLCATSEEYPSNVYPWQKLASRGVELRSVPAPGGRIEPEAFAAAGNERTRVLAVSSVQYASGWRVDLPALGRLCRERGWLLCVDGIQSVGAMPVDVKQCGAHFLSADSHKWMLGIPGIGIHYVARELATKLDPVLVGWRSTREAMNFDQVKLDLKPDARRFEEGNLPYALIEGMGAAVEMFHEVGMDRVWGRICELNEYLVRRLQEAGHTVTSPTDRVHRAGSVLFQPRGGNAQALVSALHDQKVMVSCRRGRVRVSPHFYTIEEELDRVVDAAR